jgi:hypothetical protein
MTAIFVIYAAVGLICIPGTAWFREMFHGDDKP